MNNENGQPWWKFGHAWMIFAGPAVVVVASFITLYLALRVPDPVVLGYGQPSQPGAVTAESASANMAPAMQARNHAATGQVPPARP